MTRITALGLCLALATPALSPAALGIVSSSQELGKRRFREYMARGEKYWKSAHYRLASEAYKLALQYVPAGEQAEVAWERHRKAFQMGRVIDGYVTKAEALMEKGLMEEAASFLRLAVKLNPRDPVLWRLYERALAQNPHVVVVTTSREAWDAFRRGREVLDGGRPEAAIRYFEEVDAFLRGLPASQRDDKLRHYNERLLRQAQEKLRKDYPHLLERTTDR